MFSMWVIAGKASTTRRTEHVSMQLDALQDETVH